MFGKAKRLRQKLAEEEAVADMLLDITVGLRAQIQRLGKAPFSPLVTGNVADLARDRIHQRERIEAEVRAAYDEGFRDGHTAATGKPGMKPRRVH